MLTLAGQRRVYAANIYIYIRRCLYVCLCVCLFVFMFVPSFWPNLWMDFSETWHDDRFWPNLKHGLKISENGYYGNEK